MYNDNSKHDRCDSLAVLYKNTYTQILVLTVFHFLKGDGHENQYYDPLLENYPVHWDTIGSGLKRFFYIEMV